MPNQQDVLKILGVIDPVLDATNPNGGVGTTGGSGGGVAPGNGQQQPVAEPPATGATTATTTATPGVVAQNQPTAQQSTPATTPTGVNDMQKAQRDAELYKRDAFLTGVAMDNKPGYYREMKLSDGRTVYFQNGDLNNSSGNVTVAYGDGTIAEIPTSAIANMGHEVSIKDELYPVQNGGTVVAPAANQPAQVATTVTEEQLNNERYPKVAPPPVMQVQGNVVNNGQQMMNGDKVEESLNKPIYKADWEKLGAKGIYQGNGSIRDNINDYLKWCEDNDVMPDWASMMLYTKDKDISKSAGENAEDEKKRQRHDRYEQLSNFFLNFGNLIGAAGFGGPKQEFEDPIKLTDRQQKLRDAVEAKRENYNNNFLNMAMKQSQQAATERRQEMQDKIAQQKMEIENMKFRLAMAKDQREIEALQAKIKESEEKLRIEQEKFEEAKRANKAKEAETERNNRAKEAADNKRADAAMVSARKRGSGKKDNYTGPTYEEEYDEQGNLEKKRIKGRGTGSGKGSKPQRDSNGKKRIKK